MTAIALEDLGRDFGDFTALAEMNLDIADGEFVALLGPSGCGKSTTMNMIAGMIEPTRGTIRFDGRDMNGVPMGRRGVGFVFQNYAIFTHMTVYSNLAYGPRMAGRPRAEVDAKVRAIADFLQLTPLLDRPSAGLSVNTLQRLAIGRSAILQPAIFLLDEPLSNVDAAFRAVMRTELKHLQREFRQTMVYVTHDQLEAMTMADRIAVMDHGRLLQVGTPLEVYNDPVDTFVARFIGSPGMNLLAGTVIEETAGRSIDLGAAGQSPVLPSLPSSAAPGERVLLGFRPERVSLADEGSVRLPVTFVERIGARTVVHLGAAETRVKAVFANDVVVRIGDVASLRIEPAAVRLFDAESGQSMRKAA